MVITDSEKSNNYKLIREAMINQKLYHDEFRLALEILREGPPMYSEEIYQETKNILSKYINKNT
jgi:hypothetical protein